MKNIILFYQHIGREIFSINRLKEVLEKQGNRVFVFSIDFEIYESYKLAKNEKIDVIVTPWLYHDMNYKIFIPFIEQNGNVKIINTHQEQLSSIMSEPVLMPLPGVSSNCCYHLAWGDFFKEKLLSRNIPRNLIYVTGNMRNDEMTVAEDKKAWFAEQYGLDLSKKWVLFAETRDFIYAWNREAKYELECKGIDSKEIEEYYNLSKNSLEATVKDIESLSKSFFQQFELIYRPHPGCLDTPVSSKCKVISKYSIYEWLKAVDTLVTWSSTSAIEADALNVPVFINEPIPNVERQRMEGLDSYPIIQSLNQLLEVDFHSVLNAQKMRKSYVNYFGEIDGKATERVGNAILKIADIFDDGYKAELIDYDKIQIKKHTYQFVLRVLIKLGIFEIVKFPHSAYAHRNDIPFYKNNLNI